MKETIEVKIYALCDPLTCKVRYIGRTSKMNLKHRLIEHITKARYEDSYRVGLKSSHKNTWIKSLLSQGQEPSIKLLTTVIGWNASHDLERCLIKTHFIKHDLVNHDDKGVGNINHHVDSVTKIRISKSLKSFYTTNINPKAKAIEVYDLEGNHLRSYPSATIFANELNVSPRMISRIAAGSYGRRQIKGYQVVYSVLNKTCSTLEYKKREKYTVEKRRKLFILENLVTNEKTEHLGLEELLDSLEIPRYMYYNRRKKHSIVTIGNYKFIPGPV